MRKINPRALVTILAISTLLPACTSQTKPPAAADATKVFEADQRNLAELNKGHSDKIQLAWYATSFLRQLDPPVKIFAEHMQTEQKRLQQRLALVAKAHHYDLSFHFGKETTGQARKQMESDDGDFLQARANPEFQLTMLRYMASDYDWQRHLIAAMLKQATDPDLKNYLDDSLKVHNAQFAEITQLLARYKFQ